MTVWPVELRTWSGDGGTWFQSHQKMAQVELDKDLVCKVVSSLSKDVTFEEDLLATFCFLFARGLFSEPFACRGREKFCFESGSVRDGPNS